MADDAKQDGTCPAEAARWEETIRRFEAEDAAGDAARGRILFVGSSTITRWDLSAYFPRDDLVNRGFGGSLLCEVAALCERYVVPPAPRQIVLYAGDNDLGSGRTPTQVLASYRAFVATVRAAMPKAPILFVSVKPSPVRRHLMEAMQETNRLVEAEAACGAGLGFLDIFTAMLTADGEPRKELYCEDELHLSHEGYLLWAKRIAPCLVD